MHPIVPSLGICLFLIWSFTVELPVIDASGPPVRLTLGQTPVRIIDQREAHIPPPAQLLPTQWQTPTHLIPTDIEFETVVTTSEDPALQETGILHTGRLDTERAEIGSLVSFLDLHLSTRPFPLKMTDYSDRPLMNFTPWIVGELRENLMCEVTSPLSHQLYWTSLNSWHIRKNQPEIDNIWLPAGEWWRMVRTAIPKSAF